MKWCAKNTAAALLVAGDMTGPLLPLTRHEAAFEGKEVLGAAALFNGFSTPVITIAAAGPEIFDLLFRRFEIGNAVLAVAADQPLPAWGDRLEWSTDPWLVSECVPDADAEAAVMPAADAGELASFYEAAGATFWCPAMLNFGHSFVIRDEGQSIVSAGSVQFLLGNDDTSYAHIGALATVGPARGQSFASLILRAVRASLARSSVRYCGVFADAETPWLLGFYERRGYQRRGAFRFAATSG